MEACKSNIDSVQISTNSYPYNPLKIKKEINLLRVASLYLNPKIAFPGLKVGIPLVAHQFLTSTIQNKKAK